MGLLALGSGLGFLLASVVFALRARAVRARWEKAGHVGVDAGLMMLADPCYVLHRDKPLGPECPDQKVGPLAPEFKGSWHEFCRALENDMKNGVFQVRTPVANGEWTSAVVIGQFGGDGIYPVFVRRDHRGLVEAAMVMFHPVERGDPSP